MQRPGVGRVVPLHLSRDRMEFTFHSPRGDHASIDHVFSDHASATYTSGVPRTPVFLGSRTDGHDDSLHVSTIEPLLVSIREGEMESLGRQRPQAQRLRGSPRELKAFLEALPTEVGLEEDDDVALASLETRALRRQPCKLNESSRRGLTLAGVRLLTRRRLSSSTTKGCTNSC